MAEWESAPAKSGGDGWESAPHSDPAKGTGGPPKPFSQPMPNPLSAANLGGVVEGITDIPIKLNQMALHALPFTGLRESEDKYVREREARIAEEQKQPGREGMDLPRTAGNVLGTAPLGAVAPAGALGAAAAGMAGGATARPVTSDKFWWETGKEAMAGAAGGAAGSAVLSGAAKVAAPVFNKAKDLLLREGVLLTPGQLGAKSGFVGETVRRGEGALSSLPLSGTVARQAGTRSIETFNSAAWNRVLEPLGLKLPDNVPVGREAANWVDKQIDSAYGQIWPNVTVTPDAAFHQQVIDITRRAGLAEEQAKKFVNILGNQSSKTQPGVPIPGLVAKGIDAELGKEARGYRGSQSWDDQKLGQALEDVKAAWRGLIDRKNPAYAEEIKAANEAYANYVRVNRAAASRGAKEGVFTPAQLGGAVRAEDPTLRKMATGRGQALLQDLSDAGEAVLPSVVRDSGTPERLGWMGLAELGGAGAGLYEHSLAPLATGAALAAPYTRAGTAAINAWARPGPTRAAAARALQGAAPFAAGPAGAVSALPGVSPNISDYASQVPGQQ